MVAAEPLVGVESLVCQPAGLICDFCDEPCGPVVRLVAPRRVLRTREFIWTSKSLASAGVLATEEEEPRMKLDPSRTRRPVPRFGWGWIDRRIVIKDFLRPMSRTEIAVYFFLCVVADRHGMSWYSPHSMARVLKEPPDQISDALTRLHQRNLIAIAGRLIQVLDLDAVVVPDPANPAEVPAQEPVVSFAAPPAAAASARDELARLPHQQREELLRRARERMATFLGAREPSTSALEAVAVGLLREKGK